MTQGSKNGGKRSKAVAAKRDAILQAGLSQFAKYGIHGATLEHIAECASVSKTNLLYYFPSKDVLSIEVLKQILSIWLAPLRAFRRDLEPLAAIGEYIRLKMEVSRDYPEASRLFCMEMLQGAPLLMGELAGDVRPLVEEKSAIVAAWVAQGKLAPVDPHHRIAATIPARRCARVFYRSDTGCRSSAECCRLPHQTQQNRNRRRAV